MRYSVSIWIQYAYSVSISLEEPIEGQTNIFLVFFTFFTFFKEIVYTYVHTRIDHSFLRKILFPHRKVSPRNRDEERNRIGKHAIKFRLNVEKLKGAKIRRAGVIRGSKDSCHTRRQKSRGGNRGRRDIAEKKGLDLDWGEHRITVGSITRQEGVRAGCRTEGS